MKDNAPLGRSFINGGPLGFRGLPGDDQSCRETYAPLRPIYEADPGPMEVPGVSYRPYSTLEMDLPIRPRTNYYENASLPTRDPEPSIVGDLEHRVQREDQQFQDQANSLFARQR